MQNFFKTVVAIGIFLYIGFFFLAYFPGFLAYRSEVRRKSVRPFLEKVVLALDDYSQKSPQKSYPSKIDNCDDLIKFVQQVGLKIDRMQPLSLLNECLYHTNDRKDYTLTVKIKPDDICYYVLTPSGIRDVCTDY